MSHSPRDAMRAPAIYRTLWRWHFYAGLAVLPVLLWLAVTGGLYLYKPELDRLIYADWSRVEPAAAPLPLARLIPAVETDTGGKVIQLARPAEADASWRMTYVRDGARRTAFVDPYRGRVLGTTREGGVMRLVRDLHSLMITGPVGNALVEIAAGWAVLLVLTGLYLWWPRRGSPVVGLRGGPRGRLFWRDLHASVGLVAGAVVLFLAVTGMPWSGVAGKALQGWVSANALGRPRTPGPNPHETARPAEHAGHETLPWSLQAAAAPHAPGAGDAGPDRAAAVAAARRLAPPWTMTLPSAPGAPYVVSQAVVRAEDARVLYLAPADGRVLQDARYADFGAVGRTIEWGIATHQGQQYGEPNRLLMLAGCLAIALLSLTAPVLWWKRRRGGRLIAPPRAADPRTERGIAAIMVAVGALFPLTGLTMLVALALDAALRRFRPALAP